MNIPLNVLLLEVVVALRTLLSSRSEGAMSLWEESKDVGEDNSWSVEEKDNVETGVRVGEEGGCVTCVGCCTTE